MSTPTRDPLSLLSERFQDSLFSPNGRWTAYRDPDKLRVVNSDDPLRYWTLPCALVHAGFDVLLDDRDERPGVIFADMT